MTDNEIIKGLECLMHDNCEDCHYYRDDCVDRIKDPIELSKDALNLINQLQAENERLKRENEILSINADTAFQDGLSEAQALYDEQVRYESIKEFAERLKKTNRWREEDIYYIDTLLEEMVGEE